MIWYFFQGCAPQHHLEVYSPDPLDVGPAALGGTSLASLDVVDFDSPILSPELRPVLATEDMDDLGLPSRGLSDASSGVHSSNC